MKYISKLPVIISTAKKHILYTSNNSLHLPVAFVTSSIYLVPDRYLTTAF
ncbi:MAG: hypothetical protein ABL872_10910 [Lacibacter sp.]